MPKTASHVHLGKMLRRAMDMTNGDIKQVDVARACHVTQPSVSEWMRFGRIHKRHYPTLVTLFRLPYEWWFGPAGGDEKITKVIAYMSNTTEKGKDEVVRVAANTAARNPRMQASLIIEDGSSGERRRETQPAGAKGSRAAQATRRRPARGGAQSDT